METPGNDFAGKQQKVPISWPTEYPSMWSNSVQNNHGTSGLVVNTAVQELEGALNTMRGNSTKTQTRRQPAFNLFLAAQDFKLDVHAAFFEESNGIFDLCASQDQSCMAGGCSPQTVSPKPKPRPDPNPKPRPEQPRPIPSI